MTAIFLFQTTTNNNATKITSELYCILFLHQTTTCNYDTYNPLGLYCILFLHQTTTVKRLRVAIDRCIASSFYIKPQLAHRAIGAFICCIASSFYIKPQQSGDTGCRRTRCIASSFYIKPQLETRIFHSNICCIASSFYIKPQHRLFTCNGIGGCIASSFYIKPQHHFGTRHFMHVVLHPLSTSNHNPRTPDTLIFGHLTASRHDTKRGGVHRGSRFDAVFTFSTNIRKIIFTEIRRCMSVQRAGARLRSDSSEANI